MKFLLLFTSIVASVTSLFAAKPNIVLIYIDDLGYGDIRMLWLQGHPHSQH